MRTKNDERSWKGSEKMPAVHAPGWLAPLRFPNAEVQDQRESRQAEQKNKGSGVASGGFHKTPGSRGREGRAHEVEVHHRVVQREVLCPIEAGCESRGDGRGGAVGKARRAEPCNAQGQRLGQHSRQGDPGGKNGQTVRQQHGPLSAVSVEHESDGDPPQAVADGEDPNQRGRKGGLRPHGERQIPGKGKDCIAHRCKTDDAEESQPEGGPLSQVAVFSL